MRNKLRNVLVACVVMTLALLGPLSPVAHAEIIQMNGTITCEGGSSNPEGLYVVNESAPSRSGWANMWRSGSVWYFAYDGADRNDTVHVNVGCGNNWTPTYWSVSGKTYEFRGISLQCSRAWGSPRCNY